MEIGKSSLEKNMAAVFSSISLFMSALTTTLLIMINVLVGQQKLLIITCYTVQNTLYREEIP